MEVESKVCKQEIPDCPSHCETERLKFVVKLHQGMVLILAKFEYQARDIEHEEPENE